MFQQTQLRIAGNTSIIVIHIANMFYMGWHTWGLHTEDERVLVFKGLNNRFLTIWTIMLQIADAVFCLICDIFILKNSFKQLYSPPSYIAEIRETIFSAIIWPSTWLVSTLFWCLFYYDRSLIFPEHLDPFLPKGSNHMLHTVIVPFVLFELMSRPRVEPSTHLKNLTITSLYIGSYLWLVLFTYKERNVWLYPIFGLLDGSVYFLPFVAGVYLSVIGFYMMQWPINKVICLQSNKEE